MRRPNLRAALGLILAGATALACGDAGGPSASGTPFFNVALDGAAWVPDTSSGLLSGLSPTDGTLNLFAVRITPGEEQSFTIVVQHFPRTGQLIVGDTSMPALGAYALLETGTGTPVPPPPLVYLSSSGDPGTVRITDVNAADSTVSGTFAFRVRATPDTAGHLAFSGSFRLRYRFQQVYLPDAH